MFVLLVMIFVLVCETLIKQTEVKLTIFMNQHVHMVNFYQQTRIDKVKQMDKKYYILNNVKIQCYWHEFRDKFTKTNADNFFQSTSQQGDMICF